MYFGMEAIWTYTFVPVAFVLVMVSGIALAFVYAVGASKGRQAALRYTRFWAYFLIVGLTIDVVWAIATGDFARFLRFVGWGPLIEMGLLGIMFIGSMLLMATSYVSSKKA